MKRNVFNLLMISAISLFFYSCINENTTPTKTENLWDWFTIDIPTNLSYDSKNSVKNAHAYYTDTRSNDHPNLYVYLLNNDFDKDNLRKLVEEEKQEYRTKFDCNISKYILTDSVASFHYNKGVFSGDEHFILKTIEGRFLFLIQYKGLSGTCKLETAEEIANSIKMRIVVPDSTEMVSIYETKYYSLQYPREWQYLEKPDVMSDVYIGSKTEQFGVMVVRFEHEANLAQINQEAINGHRRLGLHVTNTQVTIAGKKGYKTISTGKIGNTDLKLVEYSFKDGDIYYNLKFGSDADAFDKYKNEITNIVNSFHLKELTEIYENSLFSFQYPSNWEIVQENGNVLGVNVSVQVMAKQINNVDFRPNINIIKSKDKHLEPTDSLATLTINGLREIIPNLTYNGMQNVVISDYNGTMIESVVSYNNYSLHYYQYFIKKKDNTTFTITCTIDNDNKKIASQKKIIEAILKSIKIK